jgi:hypothetical protein
MQSQCHGNTCNCHKCAKRLRTYSLLEEILAETPELPDKLTGVRLTSGNKDSFRSQAQRGRDKIAEWVKRCEKLKAEGKDCHIHHVIPLQYIHLFKGRNPNRRDNVLLLADDQHKTIHAKLRALLKGAQNNIKRKRILENFRKGIMTNKYYASARIPSSNPMTTLKELFRELNL